MSLDIQTLKALIAANRNRKAYEGFSHSIRLQTYLLSNADAIVKELDAGRELGTAASALNEYIIDMTNPTVCGLDIPDAIYIPFTAAIAKMDEATK